MTAIKFKLMILISLVLLMSTGSAWAIPGIALDTDYTTHNYDPTDSSKHMESVIMAEANEDVWLAVVAQNVTKLAAYQVTVSFDPEHMNFIEGAEGNPSQGVTNLLKKNSGETIGLQIVQRIPGTLDIFNSLIGKNPDEAADGSGIIALLKFKVLDDNSDNRLNLSNILYLDPEGTNYPVSEFNIKNAIQNPSSGQDKDTDKDGMPDEWEKIYFTDLSRDGTGDYDKDGKSDLDEYKNGTDPTKPAELALEPGVFMTGKTGTITIDWLYDGGAYKGELGMFSLRDMDMTVSDLTAFIREAVTRVLSHSEEGYIVLSDKTERARESGTLSGESADWNEGDYNHAKSFSMRPDDRFALVLVPNGTFEALSQNPGTGNTALRPLFSFTSPNADYGMHMGQVADVNGMELGFVFEDMEFTKSDRDYNDLIIQISGADSDIPTIDAMIGKTEKAARRKRDGKDWYDWRVSDELGRKIMEHLEALPTGDDQWVSVVFDGAADFRVYDAEGSVTGTENTEIPGSLRFLKNDELTVSLPAMREEEKDYRIMLRSVEDETETLTVIEHLGMAEISSDTKVFDIEPLQTLKSDLSVSSGSDMNAVFKEPAVPTDADGKPLIYDFDGNGKIDDDDIREISSRWNSCEGDPDWNPLADLDDDGCITVLDIMKVSSSK
ncbi:DUF4114 domain-containing protein [Desulfonema magnum]|uniref:Cohesin domain-containing protein n=1 Tax=Desulfonema magnum TaxID=45655 RepID=A0A975GLA0_9BACT|nr:DUF4114 domain-containing protein [Desulfonema magnum]QTA85424.1 Cohesin domain-containing protein [Desulfonema magnum]